MESRSKRASTTEIRRVAAATERWEEAKAARPLLWPELTDRDKERLAVRRLRAAAAKVGWDTVLRRLGIGRRSEE